MSDALNKALAKEFLEAHPDLTGDNLEEVFVEFLRGVKNSSSGTITLYLNKVISGRSVLASIKRRMAIRERAKKTTKKSSPDTTIESFAKKAIQAAKASKNKWHSQAYIYRAWEEMPGSMSLSEFKTKLLKAYQSDLLVLHRADLVEAMSADDLRKSEIKHFGYSYHLIQLG